MQQANDYPSATSKLPDEVLSIILDYALETVGSLGHAPGRTYREIGDLLCVSSRFYSIAMPLLYRSLRWSYIDDEAAALLKRQDGLSGYLGYVRELDLPMPKTGYRSAQRLVEKLIDASNSSAEHNLWPHCLQIEAETCQIVGVVGAFIFG